MRVVSSLALSLVPITSVSISIKFSHPEDGGNTLLRNVEGTFTTRRETPQTTIIEQLLWKPENFFVFIYFLKMEAAGSLQMSVRTWQTVTHNALSALHFLFTACLWQLTVLGRWVVAAGAVMVMVMVYGCGDWWWGVAASRRDHCISGSCCVCRRQVFVETQPATCSARIRRRESRQTACQSQISVINKTVDIITELRVQWTLNTAPLLYLTTVIPHFLLLLRGGFRLSGNGLRQYDKRVERKWRPTVVR